MRFAALLLAVLAPAGAAQTPGERLTVEFRAYTLLPDQRDTFHQLVLETLPLLARYQMDVVAYGPSPHDTTSYYLIRAFSSPAHRLERHEAFYGSADWREGPRERVLALIETFTTVVMQLDATTVRGLRQSAAP